VKQYNVYDAKFKKVDTVKATSGKDAIRIAKQSGVFAPMVHELDHRGNERDPVFERLGYH